MTNTVFITTSGIGERLGSITKHTNKSLVKVGDKYAICYIVELYNEPDTEFIVTLGYYGNYVKDFLLLAYPSKHFKFVDIDLFVGAGSSLGYSMLKAKDYLQKPFIFHCCDSVILDKIKFDKNKNCLFVYPFGNSDQYTNIKGQNGMVIEINNKKHNSFDFIYTGVSYIHDYKIFWTYLQDLYENNKQNVYLNDVDSMKLMLKNHTVFHYTVVEKWYDTGNLGSYEKIKNEFKPNYNVIEKTNESICFLDNRVIKFVNDSEINKKRVMRGQYLYPLSPKILGFSNNFMSMELIDGIVLSNLYESRMIYKLMTWAKNNLWNKFYVNTQYIDNCKRFYVTKTLSRLSETKFLKNEKNIVNGFQCENVVKIIQELPEKIWINTEFTKIHGDFILENIIKTSDSYKLIDWRHEFDTELYHGDIYYDFAKLRHNIIFNHANILNNLFTIDHKNNEVTVDLKCNFFLIQQLEDFDRFVHDNNYDIKKIKLITAIIWLNMAPLYDGKISDFLFYFGKYNLNIIKEYFIE